MSAAIYGGSRSAILLNIPGTPASAASTLDGYPLARQGLAGRAMGISTSGSWLGTLFGILCLALLTPVLSELALDLPEFRVLLDLRVRRRGGRYARRRRSLKGYIAGFLGLFIATIGQEPYYNYQRYAFGFTDLAGGIGLLPALVGAYGVAEVLQAMRGLRVKAISSNPRFDRPAHRGRAEILAHHLPIRRHRRMDRHSSRARRGCGGVVVLRGRAPRQQGRRRSSAAARSRA